MNTTVLYDDALKPSMMVRIPKFKVSDVIPGGPEVTHPAFIVDGVEIPEIYISKYQNIIVNDRAYSLPFQEPATRINFDQAKQACEMKGKGWHLMTNAEWAAIALWCLKNGTLPRGNNNYGSDYHEEDERGVSFNDYQVLTGSGPATWTHDHTEDGIYDLNGNVWEWVAGLRLLSGEIQIIPDNNAAKAIDQSRFSEEWQPVTVDGKILKFTETDNGISLTTDEAEGWDGCRFMDLESDVEVPELLKTLALFPAEGTNVEDRIWADADGECLPYRGGSWFVGSSAGVFGWYLNHPSVVRGPVLRVSLRFCPPVT